MMGYGIGYGLGGWLMMAGWMILVVAAIAVLAWFLLRGGSAMPSSAPMGSAPGHDALEILKMRFVRGEITRDEYLAAKQTVEGGR